MVPVMMELREKPGTAVYQPLFGFHHESLVGSQLAATQRFPHGFHHESLVGSRLATAQRFRHDLKDSTPGSMYQRTSATIPEILFYDFSV